MKLLCHHDCRFHKMGEAMIDQRMTATPPRSVDTYGGQIYGEWDPQAAVTPLGQLPFFIVFLKTRRSVGDLGAGLSSDVHQPQCARTGGPAGTLLLSVLSWP